MSLNVPNTTRTELMNECLPRALTSNPSRSEAGGRDAKRRAGLAWHPHQLPRCVIGIGGEGR